MFKHLHFNKTGPDGIPRAYTNFLGVGIEGLTYDEMVRRIDGWIAQKDKRSHHIACINAYCITLAWFDEGLRKIYNQSDLAGPDGMPFVRFIRRFAGLKCDRFDAPDIALHLAEQARHKGYTFYLYGGDPAVLESMKIFLSEKFPHLQIVGSYSPPFRSLTETEDDAICNEINAVKPDILLVGLGTPKQDHWIDTHLEKIPGAVFIASGATFDFFGGRIKLAPEWIRRSGFEWLYRLFSKDFTRLFKRYTYYNIIFLCVFFLQVIGVKKIPCDPSYR